MLMPIMGITISAKLAGNVRFICRTSQPQVSAQIAGDVAPGESKSAVFKPEAWRFLRPHSAPITGARQRSMCPVRPMTKSPRFI